MTDTPAPSSDNGAPAAAAAAGDTANQQHMIPKARLDEEVGKRRALEAELTAVADAFLTEVPEALKPLIPEGLSPAEKIKWFQKAKATGVFGKGTVEVPETDTGKPKVTPKDVDLSQLPPMARIARGYGKK